MGGIPVLANVSAALAATVNARHNGGDHSLFIGRIVGLRDDGRALWFIMNLRKETAADQRSISGSSIRSHDGPQQ